MKEIRKKGISNMEKRKYGSKNNAKVKSPTGNEFNEGASKNVSLMKKRMAEGKKVLRSI